MPKVLVFLMLMMEVAMARDGYIQPPRAPVKAPATESAQDRYMDELYERFDAGEIDLTESRRLFEERFGPLNIPPEKDLLRKRF